MEKTTKAQPRATKEAYEEALKKDLMSGCLKFSRDYVSNFQLYLAVTDWVDSDPNVLRAAIRGGGSNQLAVDFLYQGDGSRSNAKASSTLERIFKKFFTEKLGEDHMRGWDYANDAVLIK